MTTTIKVAAADADAPDSQMGREIARLVGETVGWSASRMVGVLLCAINAVRLAAPREFARELPQVLRGAADIFEVEEAKRDCAGSA